MTQFVIEVVVDPSKAAKGARQVRTELQKTEGSASKLRSQMARVFGAAALLAGVVAATKTLAAFGQEMSTVAAITQATGAEFDALEAKAKQLGISTRFSATQAAEGMTFLARSGFEANEILSAIDGTLNLAQSGALGLGQAADIASNALQAFRLEADQTGRVVDVLSLAANSSNTTVAQLGDGLKLVAPIAAGVGVEIEEVTGAISALSNAGLQATLAGTGLRRVISELESPSTKTARLLGDLGLETADYKVSSVGLTSALEALAKAGVDTGLGLEVFGDRGGPAFEVLRTSLPQVVGFTEALRGADGTAERIAATMDDNLNGSLLALRSAFEGLVLETGEQGATGALRGFFDVTTIGLRALADNLEAVIAVSGTLALTFAAIRIAPIATEALAAAVAFGKLRIAVATGNAVMLGSVEATRQQAVAEVLAAEAVAAKTAATLAAIAAEQAKAVIVRGSAEATFIQAAIEKQTAAATAANVAATNALTASRLRLVAATNATTIASRALALVNPFTAAIAAGVAFGFILKGVLDDLVEVEAAALAVNEAGLKFGKSEFGKIGDDIIRVRENMARLTTVIGAEISATGKASEGASKKMADYKADLERLTVASDLLAGGLAQTSEQALEMARTLENIARSTEDAIAVMEEENRLLQLNSREREIQIALLQEVEALERKFGEGTVTAAQRAQLEEAIRVNQAYREQAEVLERIKGPQATFRTDLAALDALLASGTISQSEFNAQLEAMAASLDATDFAALELDGFLEGIDGVDTEGLRKLLEDLRAASAEGGLVGPPVSKEDQLPGNLTPDTGPLSPGLQLQVELLEQIQGPQALFLATQTQLNQLLNDGAISAEEYAIALNDAKIAANTLSTDAGQGLAAGLAQIQNQILDVSGTVQGALVNSFGEAKDALTDFAKTGELDFDSFVGSVLDGIAEILVQQALLALIPGGGGAAGGAGGIAGAIGGIFAGGRAGGGDVNAGEVVRVGEQGPELFAPATGGTVIPAGETAALMSSQRAAAPVVNVSPPQVNIRNVIEGEDEAEREAETLNTIRRNRRTVRGFVG